MGLPSSGLSNEDLTIRVEDFVDRMIELDEQSDETLWIYFPPLVAASAGSIVFELWRRYRSGRISFDEFKIYSLKTLGVKAAKYAAILAALAVPGLNVLVGAFLLGSLILAVNDVTRSAPSFRPFAFLSRK